MNTRKRGIIFETQCGQRKKLTKEATYGKREERKVVKWKIYIFDVIRVIWYHVSLYT